MMFYVIYVKKSCRLVCHCWIILMRRICVLNPLTHLVVFFFFFWSLKIIWVTKGIEALYSKIPRKKKLYGGSISYLWVMTWISIYVRIKLHLVYFLSILHCLIFFYWINFLTNPLLNYIVLLYSSCL